MTSSFHKVGAMEDLIALIKNGDLASLQTAISQEGIDINQKDSDGRTLLMHAVLAGAKEVAEMLIKVANANVDLIDKDGKTALMMAAERSDEKTVELLYCCKASVLIKNNDGNTVADLVNVPGSNKFIKEFIAKRIYEINIIITLLNDLLKNNSSMNKNLSEEDLLLFREVSDVNEIDFMLAAFHHRADYRDSSYKILWDPIEVWDRICEVRLKSRAMSLSSSTDSEESDASFSVRHDTSPTKSPDRKQSLINDKDFLQQEVVQLLALIDEGFVGYEI